MLRYHGTDTLRYRDLRLYTDYRLLLPIHDGRLEYAQTTLADTPVPTEDLDGLVEKGFYAEENKNAIRR